MPFKSLGVFSYSPSIATMAISFVRYSDLLVENRANFIPHLYLAPPPGVTPSEFRDVLGIHKTRMNGLSCGEEIMTIRSAVLIQCQRVTDRQTDGRPAYIYYTCFSIADSRNESWPRLICPTLYNKLLIRAWTFPRKFQNFPWGIFPATAVVCGLAARRSIDCTYSSNCRSFATSTWPQWPKTTEHRRLPIESSTQSEPRRRRQIRDSLYGVRSTPAAFQSRN